MKTIIGARRTGKTYQLIKEAVEKDLYILTADRGRAACIEQMARDMLENGEIPRPMRYPVTVHEVKHYGFNSQHGRYPVLIDEAEAVLRQFLETQIETITISAGEVPQEEIGWYKDNPYLKVYDLQKAYPEEVKTNEPNR